MPTHDRSLANHLQGKSAHTLELFNHFVAQFESVGDISLRPARSMIAIRTSRKSIAYITQLGKAFIRVVFPFEKPYPDNLCFQKIAQVPGDAKQFNHHFRMLQKEDVNKEVVQYMKLAYRQGI